jgi:hypothetical protein
MDIIYQDSRCLALEEALHDEGVRPIDLPFMLLRAITKDFSDTQLIGRGGFGEVYKVCINACMLAINFGIALHCIAFYFLYFLFVTFQFKNKLADDKYSRTEEYYFS